MEKAVRWFGPPPFSWVGKAGEVGNVRQAYCSDSRNRHTSHAALCRCPSALRHSVSDKYPTSRARRKAYPSSFRDDRAMSR